MSVDNDLISAARTALSELSGDKAEQLYDELIAAIESKHAGNQREVAATLSQLAKTLEAEDSLERAMQFKQRTTEVMLKRSMAARMAERQLPKMQNQPKLEPAEPLPFIRLEYLYMGCADFDRDLKYYTQVLQGHLLWAFDKFGARVAAVRLAQGPPLLIATHRTAPSCQPIFSVASLDTTTAALRERGWKAIGEPVETPNGNAYAFCDPSGNELAILQNDNPDTMERAYADKANPNAIRLNGEKPK